MKTFVKKNAFVQDIGEKNWVEAKVKFPVKKINILHSDNNGNYSLEFKGKPVKFIGVKVDGTLSTEYVEENNYSLDCSILGDAQPLLNDIQNSEGSLKVVKVLDVYIIFYIQDQTNNLIWKVIDKDLNFINSGSFTTVSDFDVSIEDNGKIYIGYRYEQSIGYIVFDAFLQQTLTQTNISVDTQVSGDKKISSALIPDTSVFAILYYTGSTFNLICLEGTKVLYSMTVSGSYPKLWSGGSRQLILGRYASYYTTITLYKFDKHMNILKHEKTISNVNESRNYIKLYPRILRELFLTVENNENLYIFSTDKQLFSTTVTNASHLSASLLEDEYIFMTYKDTNDNKNYFQIIDLNKNTVFNKTQIPLSYLFQDFVSILEFGDSIKLLSRNGTNLDVINISIKTNVTLSENYESLYHSPIFSLYVNTYSDYFFKTKIGRSKDISFSNGDITILDNDIDLTKEYDLIVNGKYIGKRSPDSISDYTDDNSYFFVKPSVKINSENVISKAMCVLDSGEFFIVWAEQSGTYYSILDGNLNFRKYKEKISGKIGTFGRAYLLADKSVIIPYYLNNIYYFLAFDSNGNFFSDRLISTKATGNRISAAVRGNSILFSYVDLKTNRTYSSTCSLTSTYIREFDISSASSYPCFVICVGSDSDQYGFFYHDSSNHAIKYSSQAPWPCGSSKTIYSNDYLTGYEIFPSNDNNYIIVAYRRDSWTYYQHFMLVDHYGNVLKDLGTFSQNRHNGYYSVYLSNEGCNVHSMNNSYYCPNKSLTLVNNEGTSTLCSVYSLNCGVDGQPIKLSNDNFIYIAISRYDLEVYKLDKVTQTVTFNNTGVSSLNSLIITDAANILDNISKINNVTAKHPVVETNPVRINGSKLFVYGSASESLINKDLFIDLKKGE